MKKVLVLLLTILSVPIVCGQGTTIGFDEVKSERDKKGRTVTTLIKNNKKLDGYYTLANAGGDTLKVTFNKGLFDGSYILVRKEALSEEAHYKDGIREGNTTLYHPNGKVKQVEEYKEGELTGELFGYDDKGAIIYDGKFDKEGNGVKNEYFPNGRIKNMSDYVGGGIWVVTQRFTDRGFDFSCTDELVRSEALLVQGDLTKRTKASFNGCNTGQRFREWMVSNLSYDNLNALEGGVVRVKFIVAGDGLLEEITVPESPSPQFAHEVVKAVIMSSPMWRAARVNDKPVKVIARMRVIFKY